MCLLQEYKDAIYLDDGSGSSRRIIWLGNIDLEDDITKFLIGFHAFTGNDFVSSFFRRGKEKCCQCLRKNRKFEKAFASLGSSWIVCEELLSLLEEFVCYSKRMSMWFDFKYIQRN